MRVRLLISCLLASVAVSCRAQGLVDLKALYNAHKWTELYDRLQHTTGAPLYRGAIGVMFNQDSQESERLLQSVIQASPHSPDAYEAAEWLSHLYFYEGRYRSLVSVMEKRWADFPNKKDNADEKAVIGGFRGLPDQTVASSLPSTLKHEPDSTSFPVSINGVKATYIFDTGAWISSISESEAKRLGLTIHNGSGTLGQAAGAQVGFRTAVAKEVAIGNTHFRDVSFAVFPDNQEPWSDLPVGQRGIVGIPLLAGMQTIRWERAGVLEFSRPPHAFDRQSSNLMFDNDHLVVSAVIQNRTVNATVDTGATTTDLYQPFADQFPALLKEQGKKATKEVRGVGHAETFATVLLPKLPIRVGGASPVLSPAHVLLKPIGAAGCIGNFGMDLFKQASSVEIDFRAMRLVLVPESAHGR